MSRGHVATKQKPAAARSRPSRAPAVPRKKNEEKGMASKSTTAAKASEAKGLASKLAAAAKAMMKGLGSKPAAKPSS